MTPRLSLLAICATSLAACKPAAPPAPAPAPAAPESAPVEAAPTPDAFAPIAALNGMDTRTPVPLQPMMAWHQKQNMMSHLVAIQGITDALAQEDWEGVAQAATAIQSSPQMQQMCEHMGAGAAGFTEQALEFHSRADSIGEAARAHDTAAVLRATSNTLSACTACHARFRQDVVDADTWQARTGSAHDPAAMHGGM